MKADAFFTILTLHGMNLTEQDKSRLTKKYSKANKMNWKDALQAIHIDLDSAILNEQKWTMQNTGQGGMNKAQNSLIEGKNVTHLSRMSLDEFKQRQGEMA